MNRKRVCTVGVMVILTLLILVGIGMPGNAQSNAGTIHQVLSTVVDERIPPLTENGYWNYTLPNSSAYQAIDDKLCPGEVAYLYGEKWVGDKSKVWGAISIQTCPSDQIASQYLDTYQPAYLDGIYENIEVIDSTPQAWMGLKGRHIEAVDNVDTECTSPIIVDARNCDAVCKADHPVQSKYYDDKQQCQEDWEWCWEQCINISFEPLVQSCKYYRPFDDAPYYDCAEVCYRDMKLRLENCEGTNDVIQADIWQNGNHIFMAQAPIFVGLSLDTVLGGCQDCMDLRDILKEEADKAELKPAEGGQTIPQEPGVPVEFVAQIGIIPNPPAIGQQTTFTVDVRGSPAGEGLSYTWYLDQTLLCQNQSCPWKAESGKHTIQVVVESNTSKQQATNALGFEVIDAPFTVVDDARAGFTIDYLGCNDNITSDDALTCTLGFTRQKEGIGKLTVIWLINGMTAATESRTDNGSVFSMDKPAPGTHTIEVQVIDPASGMARVKQAVVDVLEGSNVGLPPGAQTGAAIGTLTGLGGWFWAEWFRARRANRAAHAPKKYGVEKEDTGEVKYEVEKEDEKEQEGKKDYNVEVDEEKERKKVSPTDIKSEDGKGETAEKKTDVKPGGGSGEKKVKTSEAAGGQDKGKPAAREEKKAGEGVAKGSSGEDLTGGTWSDDIPQPIKDLFSYLKDCWDRGEFFMPESDKNAIDFQKPFGVNDPIFEVEQDVTRMDSVERARAITERTLMFWKAEKGSKIISVLAELAKTYKLFALQNWKKGFSPPPVPITKVNWQLLGDKGELYKKYDAWWDSNSWTDKLMTRCPQNSIEAKELRDQYLAEKQQWELNNINRGPEAWDRDKDYQYLLNRIEKIEALINDRNFY